MFRPNSDSPTPSPELEGVQVEPGQLLGVPAPGGVSRCPLLPGYGGLLPTCQHLRVHMKWRIKLWGDGAASPRAEWPRTGMDTWRLGWGHSGCPGTHTLSLEDMGQAVESGTPTG